MLVQERLSMVVSVTLIGLALYFVIDLPAQMISWQMWGQPVEIIASTRTLMTVLLGGLAFTGAGAVIHSHPDKRISYTVPFWVNATLLVILAILVLARLGSPLAWVVGLFVTGTILWLSILAEYHTISPQDKVGRWAALFSQGLSYALMLAFAFLIYQSAMGQLLKALSLTVISGALSASIFRLTAKGSGRGFALLVMLAIAQLSLVLMLWPVGATGASLLTLLAFYALCGLINAHLQNALSRRVVIEYVAVIIIGLVLLQILRFL